MQSVSLSSLMWPTDLICVTSRESHETRLPARSSIHQLKDSGFTSHLCRLSLDSIISFRSDHPSQNIITPSTPEMPSRNKTVDLEVDEAPITIDPYIVLNLEKDASADQVKTAYRKAALKHHPDKASSEDKDAAHTKFKRLHLHTLFYPTSVDESATTQLVVQKTRSTLKMTSLTGPLSTASNSQMSSPVRPLRSSPMNSKGPRKRKRQSWRLTPTMKET